MPFIERNNGILIAGSFMRRLLWQKRHVIIAIILTTSLLQSL